MAILSKGVNFSSGDQVTSANLDNLVDAATFVTGSSGSTDDSSLEVNGSGRLQIKASGVTAGKIASSAVTTAKLADSSATTDGVTFGKIRYMGNLTVIGNVSGASAAPSEVTIYDEDNMSTNSATGLATQQSIKAYVDTGAWGGSAYSGGESVRLPNGLILKTGVATGRTNHGDVTITFGSAFPTGVVSVFTSATNATGEDGGSADYWYQVRSTSASSVVLYGQNSSSNSWVANNVHWMVLGY